MAGEAREYADKLGATWTQNMFKLNKLLILISNWFHSMQSYKTRCDMSVRKILQKGEKYTELLIKNKHSLPVSKQEI